MRHKVKTINKGQDFHANVQSGFWPSKAASGHPERLLAIQSGFWPSKAAFGRSERPNWFDASVNKGTGNLIPWSELMRIHCAACQCPERLLAIQSGFWPSRAASGHPKRLLAVQSVQSGLMQGRTQQDSVDSPATEKRRFPKWPHWEEACV